MTNSMLLWWRQRSAITRNQKRNQGSSNSAIEIRAASVNAKLRQSIKPNLKQIELPMQLLRSC